MIKTETTTIKASVRQSLKLGENYFTIEWTEEQSVKIDPKLTKAKLEAELAKARESLWNTCIQEVDEQTEEIIELYRETKKRR